MGLDMFLYKVQPTDVFEIGPLEFEMKNAKEIGYWRKHHDLHGWMHNLYNEKRREEGFDYVTADKFNCMFVPLTLEDIEACITDITAFNLPHTTGFFFGDYPPTEESNLEDIQILTDAENAIKDGWQVFYYSWW